MSATVKAAEASENVSVASVRSSAYPRAVIAWTTVAILFVLYVLSLLDRQLISLLVQPIRRDLGITDFEVSLLSGFAFGVCYAICGLPIGWLVDRVSRRSVIFWGVMMWSMATTLCGLAKNYFYLFLARIGVGAGEAALSPASYSLLADTFPTNRLTLAVNIYSLGGPAGIGAAWIVGGLIVGNISGTSVDVPVFGAVRDWQLVFIVLGLPGALLAFLAFALREKPREAPRAATNQPQSKLDLAEAFSFIWSRRRLFFCHHLGFTIANAGNTGMVIWYPAYMMRTYGWTPAQAGPTLGLVYVVGATLGLLLSGIGIDRSYGKGCTDAHMRWFAIWLVAATPLSVAGIMSGSPNFFLFTVFALQVLIAGVQGIAAASLQIIAPSHLRGRLSAIFLFVTILLGIGMGPSVVAAFTDFVLRDDNKIGWSLILTSVTCFVGGAVLLWLGMAPLRAAVAEQRHRGTVIA